MVSVAPLGSLGTVWGVKILEVERKFLLRGAPDLSVPPFAGCEVLEIEQGYLAGELDVRVRRTLHCSTGVVVFERGLKRRLAAGIAEEDPVPISESEFLALSRRLDSSRPRVRKLRRLVPWNGRVFELDEVFAPSRSWVLEVEFADASELSAELDFPPGIRVARELTATPRAPRPSVLVPTPASVRERLARMAASSSTASLG